MNQANEILKLGRSVWLTSRYKGAKTKPNKIVVKLTRDCNLRCTYCYVSGGARKEKISPDLVESFFDQAAENNPRVIDCTFHGGEPLLAGKVLKEVVQKLEKKEYSPRLQFSIQTNGTLITKKWAKYFKEKNFSVGISLDGPREINDQSRIYGNGKGSFDQIMRGIRYLQDQDVGVGLITVVTKKNIDHLIEILEFCKDMKISAVSFLPYFPAGYGANKEKELRANNLIYWKKTKEVIEWLVKHNSDYPTRKIYEREIASIVRNIVIPGNGCYMCASSPCGAGTQHVGLDVNGDIYVCDTFYGLSDYIIGNILKSPFDEILKNPLVKKFAEHNVHTVPKCSKCHLNKYCYGGCVAHNVFYFGEEGWNKESHLCGWFMKIITYLKKQFDDKKINPILLSELPQSFSYNNKGKGVFSLDG